MKRPSPHLEKKDLIKNLDENYKTIVIKAKKQSRFTILDACKWVPELGEQSIRTRINYLIDVGLLEKVGKTKSTSYTCSEPIQSFL